MRRLAILLVALSIASPVRGEDRAPDSGVTWLETFQSWLSDAISQVLDGDVRGFSSADPPEAELGPMNDPDGLWAAGGDPPEAELGPMNDPNG